MAIVTMSLHPLGGGDAKQAQRVGHDHTKGGYQRQACVCEVPVGGDNPMAGIW